MGELHSKLLEYQNDNDRMDELAKACGIQTTDKARTAYGLAVPAVIQGLIKGASSRLGTKSLMKSAGALSWVERSEPEKLFANSDHRIGVDVIDKVFATRTSTVCSRLATEVEITEVSAKALLEVTGLVTLANLSSVSRDEFTEAFFTKAIHKEDGGPSEAASLWAFSDSPEDASDEVAPLPDSEQGNSGAITDDSIGGSDQPATENSSKKGLVLIGGFVAILVLGIIASQAFGGGETTTDGEAADELAIVEDDTEPVETADDAGTEDEEDVDVSDDSQPVLVSNDDEDSDIVKLSIPMHDIEGTTPEASGVLSFELNQVTGEVCYSVESALVEGPYRSHIHAGKFGEKGGIVVDLGPLESGDTGCVDNLPVDTRAILADRSGHYAEIHDLSEEWTVRGQLSETIDGDVVSIAVPMLDIEGTTPEASGVLSFELNQVTGEVCYSVKSALVAGPYRSHIHVGTVDEKGGIVVDLGPLESGDTGCVDNLPVDTQAILANRSGHYAELHDLSEEWTVRGQLSDTIDGDVVTIAVPMTDIEGTTPEASGVLSFELNQVTGQVCYSVESALVEGPYRSHIHVGTVDEKGGIVVDLGPLESGDTGCVDNLPVDTQAILANRSGHYAELHDLSEEWTVRGQLSETVESTNVAGSDAVVDTDGGGARIVLDGGTIYLEGDVPDQATANELVTSLVRVSSATPVVDNLTVVPGAPLPSGRIVIADAVFFNVNSDEVKQIDEQTLSAITALAQSRDDWILTVVGHTDGSGSDVYNLELSLRRASALRDLLAQQGIPDENLRVRGAGETAPIGDNNTEEGRAQNRRIEFEFTPSS